MATEKMAVLSIQFSRDSWRPLNYTRKKCHRKTKIFAGFLNEHMAHISLQVVARNKSAVTRSHAQHAFTRTLSS